MSQVARTFALLCRWLNNELVPQGAVPTKPTVLVFCDWFLPGYRAGGPLRSLDGLTTRLSSVAHFRIVTRDRDLGVVRPYEHIQRNVWTINEQREVQYLTPGSRRALRIAAILWSEHYDTIHLNSAFSFWFSIVPLLFLRIGLNRRTRILLAPRGECNAAALLRHAWRKRAYLAASRLLKLHRGITFMASSELDAVDIRHVFGAAVHIVVARDLAPLVRSTDAIAPAKVAGEVRLAFVGRIAKMKNLRLALEALTRVRSRVTFDVYGPVEDEQYWRQCQAALLALPEHVSVKHHGPIPHAEVATVLATHHGFVLPSFGENFGHVVLEAFLAGCVPLVSDRTPWRDLQSAEVGWTLPLDADQFATAIDQLAAMDDATFHAMRERAKLYGARAAEDKEALRQNTVAVVGEPVTAGRGMVALTGTLDE